MIRQYTLTAAAEKDLDGIAGYLDQQVPDLGLRFYDAARSTFARLAESPHKGRERRFRNPELRGVRSWRVDSFRQILVIYRPTNEGIEIIRVLHGAMNLDARL